MQISPRDRHNVLENADRERILDLLDGYLDAAPRVASNVERIGPFTLFVGTGGWSYYARPTPGHAADIGVKEVRAVMARQRQLTQPEAFEWVKDTAPALGDAARAAGLEVRFMPLMALTSEPRLVKVPGIRTRVLEGDDETLGPAVAAVEAGFKAPGTAIGPEDTDARDLQLPRIGTRVAFIRQLIRDGHLVFVVAETDQGPVAGGSAAPQGEIAELAGIATLPAFRRRGIGASVTATLASIVRARGVRLAALSASDASVARVYASVGFVQVGTVGEAAVPRPRPALGAARPSRCATASTPPGVTQRKPG